MAMMWLLLLLCCGALRVTGGSLAEKYRSLVQASDYHLQELRKNVEELHLLKGQMDAHVINKRSLEGNLMPSLLVFCDALSNPGRYSIASHNSTDQEVPQTLSPGSTTQSSISTDNSRIPPSEESDRWEHSDPEPVRVEISQDDDDIKMTFEVRSRRSYKAIRTTTFLKTKTKFVKKKKKKSLGQVSFSFPVDQCSTGLSERVVFLSKDQESVSLSMDVCQHMKQAANSSGERRISEDVSLPQYRLLGQNWGDIKIENGRNTTIDLEVKFITSLRLSVTATMYDTLQGQFINSEVRIYMPSVTDKLVFDRWPSEGSLLQVQELEPVVNNATRNSTHGKHGDVHNQGRGIDRKMRLTVNTDSGHRSGYLNINFYKPGAESDDSLVSYVFLNKNIALKKPGQKHAFPRGKFFFQRAREFYCTPDDSMGKNDDCLVFCSVMGRGITNVTIRRKDATPGERDRVLKWKLTNAGVISNLWASLGPRNVSLHGEYTCEVTDNRGVTNSTTLKVNAASPPRVDQNMTSIQDMHNGSVLLTCVGSGRPPLNTTIYLDELTENGIVEPDITETSSLDEFTEEVSSSVLVPTTLLQWPRSWVYCRVENNDGWDEYSLNIMDYVKNYYSS